LHRLIKWVAALLLIGVASGGAGMGTLLPSASPQPGRPAPAKSSNNRYRVTMAGSTTFEVFALSSHYSHPKVWWRPDGTPLKEAPADPSQDVYFGHKGEALLDILVRVKDLPEDATFKWVPTYDHSCLTYLGGVTKDGRSVPEVRAYVVSLRPDRKTGIVQIQLAAGPWKTVVSDAGKACHGGVTTIKDGHKFYFGQARRHDGGTTIAVAHNLVDVDTHNRLVAIDHLGNVHPADRYADAQALTDHSFVNPMGREHPANYASKAHGEIIGMLDAEFSLPLEQIREFCVQSRPFERAEIKDIALHPRTSSN
jgi:hypothetical protein